MRGRELTLVALAALLAVVLVVVLWMYAGWAADRAVMVEHAQLFRMCVMPGGLEQEFVVVG